MEFRLKIPILKSSYPIDYNSKIVSIGSCFAVNIANKLDYYKFQNFCNPFGIIFNPVSIQILIERAVQKRFFIESDIFFHNDLWHCYELHSELSNPDKEVFLANLNKLVKQTHSHINEATHFQITYGTSWVYRLNDNNQIVANCHKVPQKEFTKELLSIVAIQTAIDSTVSLIQTLNPGAKFIFTVSPVRHIKDGYVENTLSKAHLITAIHSFIKTDALCSYFPSYEIMMDELRDYRFYAADMLHPSELAVDFIWGRFQETAISESVFDAMAAVDSIQKSLGHKPFNLESVSHQKFLLKLNNKINNLAVEYPNIKF
ncbi:GSCFA domain-containing protein [Flavobacterium algicola]|uniref:GSCFA domain-containing protein n=1 Tax=Flavobacterium algicola TaxID=556529 RepID=UPI001EFC74ED|nr:GSCFA domain-containing protein [Flavobacterium algicola]MCG9791288.1 GSCFA domain-containing protein [Flavobacterium algicola]